MSHPVPIGVPIDQLRPTQMTVGLREVAEKRRRWREADAAGRASLLRRHVLPAVIGRRGHAYIVDHHHFARALLDEQAGPVAVYVIADLSHLPKSEFWSFLDNSGWCHAYDGHGKRRELADIPTRLGKMKDDPFRSLVGALIRGGGVAKTARPFAEFLWADYLRRRIDGRTLADDFESALSHAMTIAKTDDAQCLPGWCGDNNGGL